MRQFPHLSETFVLAQIITAIKADLDVRILVSEILDFEASTHLEVLEKHQIRKKLILEDYQIPRNRIIRVLKAGLIVLKQIAQLRELAVFLKHKKKFSLTWIYQFHFYSQFKNVEIIHIQYGTNIHPVDILKSIGFFQGRLIVSFHGHDAFFPINGFIQNNGYYNYLFGGDNLIIANTSYLAERIKELGCPEKNLKVIPVGVDTDFFKVENREKPGGSVKFVNVGRLDKVKGQMYAIEFIKMMKERDLDVELTIIGDGAERENLVSLINKHQLADSVFLVGKKSQEEVRNYLAESDIYILTAVPLKDGRRETQGLATLEAAAAGLPVLAFDSGGVRYTIVNNETGYLCKEYDMKCLWEKATFLLDKKSRIEMGEKARNFVEQHFAQEKIDREWKKIYSSERE
nr:glycosyltransferase [Salinimicrobium sediminilitoris]